MVIISNRKRGPKGTTKALGELTTILALPKDGRTKLFVRSLNVQKFQYSDKPTFLIVASPVQGTSHRIRSNLTGRSPLLPVTCTTTSVTNSSASCFPPPPAPRTTTGVSMSRNHSNYRTMALELRESVTQLVKKVIELRQKFNLIKKEQERKSQGNRDLV